MRAIFVDGTEDPIQRAVQFLLNADEIGVKTEAFPNFVYVENGTAICLKIKLSEGCRF